MNEPLPAFIDGQYLLVFVGTTNGVVKCDTFAQFKNTLADTYPNPGDPVRAHLLNPRNWQVAQDDAPYFAEFGVFTGEEDYRVFVARNIELES